MGVRERRLGAGGWVGGVIMTQVGDFLSFNLFMGERGKGMEGGAVLKGLYMVDDAEEEDKGGVGYGDMG